MIWELDYLPEVQKDIRSLSRNQQIIVEKAIKKVKENPLPQNEGGLGKPLGNKHGTDLTNLVNCPPFLCDELSSHGITIF